MEEFTFYWLDGKREVLTGIDEADALNRAGYGSSARHALDVWASGNDNKYEWDGDLKSWKLKRKFPI
jgi:hypothetical protein